MTWFLDFFRENILLKLVSILLALLIKFYYFSPENFTTEVLRVPIRIVNIPKEKIIVAPYGAENDLFAKMELRGPGPLIDQLRTSKSRFEISLPAHISDSHVVELDQKSLGLHTSIRVLDIDPERITLRFDEVIEKELEVSISTLGDLPEGYILTELTASPSSVIAQGPRSELERLNFISTESIELNNFKQTKSLEVQLVERNLFTELSKNSVLATFGVSTIEQIKEFSGIDVIGKNGEKGVALSLRPSKVSVIVTGPVEALEVLGKEGIQARLDTRALPSGSHLVTPGISLPAGLRVVSISPARISATVLRDKPLEGEGDRAADARDTTPTQVNSNNAEAQLGAE